MPPQNKICPHKIWPDFQIKSPHYNGGEGYGAETMKLLESDLQTHIEFQSLNSSVAIY